MAYWRHAICVCYQDMAKEEPVWMEGRGGGGTGERGRSDGGDYVWIIMCCIFT